jgi:hypothetical protein
MELWNYGIMVLHITYNGIFLINVFFTIGPHSRDLGAKPGANCSELHRASFLSLKVNLLPTKLPLQGNVVPRLDPDFDGGVIFL